MEARFCKKCGRPLLAGTQLCPVCDAAQQKPLTPPAPTPPLTPPAPFAPPAPPAAPKKKRSKLPVILAVIAALLAVAVIILIIVLKSPSAGRNSEAKRIRKAYATFFSEQFVSDIGIYDTNHAAQKADGVYSAWNADLDHNDSEELLVAYATTNGNAVENRIACYTCQQPEQTTQTSETASSEVLPCGSVVLCTDEQSDGGDGLQMNTERLLYTVEYEGVSYIIYEKVDWLEGWRYEAHVYTTKDGTLQEVSDIFIRDINSSGKIITYSALLPAGLLPEDISLDAEDGEGLSLAAEYAPDATVLYYADGSDSSYVFDAYFASHEEPVFAFFKCYGITRRNLFADDYERSYKLDHDDSKNLIYSFLFLRDDGTSGARYEFSDYSETETLIEEAEQAKKEQERSGETAAVQTVPGALTAEQADFDKFEEMLSADFTWTDFTVKHGEKKTVNFSEMSQYELIQTHFCPPCLYNYFYRRTDEEYYARGHGDPKGYFFAEGEKLDAEKADWIIENIFGIQVSHDLPRKYTEDDSYGNDTEYFYYYDDAYLYVFPFEGGFEGSDKYEIIQQTRLADGTYEIKVRYDWYEDFGENAPTSRFLQEVFILTFRAVLKNDDSLGHYWQLKGYTIERENSDDIAFQMFDAYSDIIRNEGYKEDYYDYSYGPTYALYDMDGDGTKELILRKGNCEAAYEFDFYTYRNGAVLLGSCEGWHSGLYLPKTGHGIYRSNGYATESGSGSDLYYYSVSGNQVKEKCVYREHDENDSDPEDQNVGDYLQEYNLKDDYTLQPLADALS